MSELPQGWALACISDLADINPKQDFDDHLPAGFVPMSHAPTNFRDKLRFEERNWGEIKKAYTNFKDGDVIFAKVTPCFENGKAALVEEMPSGIAAGSSEFYVLRPSSPEVSAKYLLALVKSRGFMREGAENMTGAVGLRRVPKKFVESYPVLVPPAAEQTRIAQKLDELLAQVDTLKARLDAIPALLKRFRQSVLAAAVSGRLTEEWQGSGYGEWSSGILGDFVGVDVGYAFKSSEFSTTGVRLLRGQNIEPGALRWTETKFYPEEKLAGLEGLFIAEGDIILAMDRPIVSAGLKLARARKRDLPCVLVQRVSRFKSFRGVTPDYLMLLLSDLSFSNYLLPNQTGSDIPHISGKQILNYHVTLPTTIEQTEIVRRVEQLFNFADQLEAKVAAAKSRIDHLTQSILAKAFKGELVPQDPNDEPASALLERIQAQRAAAPKAKRGRMASA